MSTATEDEAWTPCPYGLRPPDAWAVFAYRDVLTQILHHAAARRHSGGLLLGQIVDRAGRPTIEIDGFAAGGPCSDNTTLAERLVGARLQQGGSPSDRVVGWFHCRPAPGPGPTPQDLLIHRALTREPWCVMLLMELGSARVTFFQAPPRGLVSVGLGILG